MSDAEANETWRKRLTPEQQAVVEANLRTIHDRLEQSLLGHIGDPLDPARLAQAKLACETFYRQLGATDIVWHDDRVSFVMPGLPTPDAIVWAAEEACGVLNAAP